MRRAALALLLIALAPFAWAQPSTNPASYGPTIANPPTISGFTLGGGQTRVESEKVINGHIFVNAGANLTLTNVRLNGGLFINATQGQTPPKVRVTNLRGGTMQVGVLNSSGNLYWGSAVPVDIVVSGSYFYMPQGSPPDHTEALAGWGWPIGVQFLNSVFIQQGPNNGTATATINWHGQDSIFDGCYFGWQNGIATYFTVYIEGTNNVVRNSWMEPAQGGAFVYPNSNPQATYVNTVNALTGALIPQSTGTAPTPTPTPTPEPEPEPVPEPVPVPVPPIAGVVGPLSVTAVGGGYYRVTVDGEAWSQHTRLDKAIESADGVRHERPDAEIMIDHDFMLKVE